MARFSLRWLFVGVAVVALFSAAYVNATLPWSLAVDLTQISAFSVAGIRVFLLHRRAAFSAGFLLGFIACYYNNMPAVVAQSIIHDILSDAADSYRYSIIVVAIQVTIGCLVGAFARFAEARHKEDDKCERFK